LRLQRRGDEILAEDLGSSSGTLVGERPLLRGVVRPIDQGESIFIGSFELRVESANAPTEVAPKVEVLPPGVDDGPIPSASGFEDDGAAFGGWLSSLEGRSGVEVSVERTRVTVKNSPPAAPVDFDESDLPTTRMAALAAIAGPLDETIRIERPISQSRSQKPSRRAETALPPVPREPLDATLPGARPGSGEHDVLRVPVPRPLAHDVNRQGSSGSSSSPQETQDDPQASKQRGGGIPTWQMMSGQGSVDDAGGAARSRSDVGPSPRSSMRNFEDRIQHQSMPEAPLQERERAFAQLPWGAVLKAAGSVAWILGLAALVFVLLQLFA
jgi:hypothetical protein